MKKIRVVLAEDQAMVRGALAALLEIEADIAVCASAANGREALTAVAQHKPDVLVTDIEMPEMTGLTLAGEVHVASADTRVVILTTFARPGYLRRALDAGAKGYLLKDRPSAELAEAVRRVHRGLRVIDPDLAAEAWDTDPTRSPSASGRSCGAPEKGSPSQEIADELHLSEGTVRNYLSEAISKLGASNRIEAARLARRKGWL